MPTDNLEQLVTAAINKQPVTDMHTHVYSPGFGTPVANGAGASDPTGLLLYGVDELLTYHYLVAEVYRVVTPKQLPYEQFWKMTKRAQADHIWKHLFVDRTPISEAGRGVVTTLTKLGMDLKDKSLDSWRKEEARQKPSDYIDKVMQIANVDSITMTNPVFDENERNKWLADDDKLKDPRFKAVLRIDPMLRDVPAASKTMSQLGYTMTPDLEGSSVEEGRRFLRDWIDLQDAIYLAVSLPPEFRYPASHDDAGAWHGHRMLEEVILPVCAERGLPFAMMTGCTRQVNPALKDAGDMVGVSDVSSVVKLCADFPDNRFFCTMLARENQHELAVAARKFGNLMVFGCWWFLNNPVLIEEITRMRMELLGSSFIPQHSDARILDQLIYKWDHSRRLIGKVLVDKYRDLEVAGWKVTQQDVEKDVKLLLKDNFLNFLK
jgi:hypothetical protein